MEEVKKVMQSLGILPRLRLGEKLKGGGVKSYGPKHVKFLSEPVGVSKKDFTGKLQKMLRFEVEHNKNRYYWYAKVLNAEGEGNYLLEKLVDVKPGDERILEMSKQGARNYVDVREVGAAPLAPDVGEGEDDDDHDYPAEAE